MSLEYCADGAVEFPVVVVQAETGQIVDEFHRYVRPTESPTLSDFCKKLTGISQVCYNSFHALYFSANCGHIPRFAACLEGIRELAKTEEKRVQLRL